MNIIDYLKWRGDLSFNVSPFNEVDNLVISQMAYTGFDDYFKEKEKFKVKELSERFFKDHTDEEVNASKSFVKLAPFVLREMANSLRYKDCLIHDFVSTIDENSFEQFCCFQIDLSDGTTYVAFRGTDDTIIGWHEDLCMSYELIPAQIAAKEYINTRLKNRKRYRIGGHSKGGALAVYGAIAANKTNNIIAVYSNDGPGLNKKYLSEKEKETYHQIKDRIYKIVPEFDLFGILFSSNRNTKVIKSDGFMVLQHSAMTWLVEGTHFIQGELSEESKMIKPSLKEFLNKASKEECMEFVDELFKALKEANLETVSDFMNGGVPVLVKTLYRLSSMNEKNKKFGSALIGAFAKGYGMGIGEKVKSVKDSFVDTILSKEKEIVAFFSKK